jgi:hypothetical protein
LGEDGDDVREEPIPSPNSESQTANYLEHVDRMRRQVESPAKQYVEMVERAARPGADPCSRCRSTRDSFGHKAITPAPMRLVTPIGAEQ